MLLSLLARKQEADPILPHGEQTERDWESVSAYPPRLIRSLHQNGRNNSLQENVKRLTAKTEKISCKGLLKDMMTDCHCATLLR